MATVANKDGVGGVDLHIPSPSKRKLTLLDGITAPDAATNYTVLYVDSADGDLKVKFADGVTKVIAADT